MTCALVSMCRRIGMFGAAVSTSSIGVGSRCPFVRAEVCAVLSQHRTDPQLGPRGLDLLAAGYSVTQVMAALGSGNPSIGWRQLTVIDSHGATVYYHGEKIASRRAAAQGDAVCASGNLLRHEHVPQAMIEAFGQHRAGHLAERLLEALEAGLAADGETRQQVKSAALLVVHEQPCSLVALRFLWELYRPQMGLYVRRAIDQ